MEVYKRKNILLCDSYTLNHHCLLDNVIKGQVNLFLVKSVVINFYLVLINMTFRLTYNFVCFINIYFNLLLRT